MWAYLSYGIPVLIVGFSIWDVVRRPPEASTNPNWMRRAWPKVTIILLGLAVLVVQAKNNTEAAAKADGKLRQALSDQRDELTAAFKTGTDQVMKSASGEAEQTRKDATSETDALKRQAEEQLTQVQGFMLGTTICPQILGTINRPSGRPDSLAIFNPDKKLNMHDLSVELIEFGPGAPGGIWSTILQRKVIKLPLIIPESAKTVPFKFLSRMTDIDAQIMLTPAQRDAAEGWDLYDTGKNVWVNDDASMFTKDGKLTYKVGEKLSLGIGKSRLDPDSQP